MLDLFAGLGGASEAFMGHPAWEVVRIDNNPMLSGVENMRMLDVMDWMDWLPSLIDEMGGPPDLFWASPECKYFSTAYAAPRSRAERAGEDYEPDMSQVEAIEDILDYLAELKPCLQQWWIVENVSGACTYFHPYFGDMKQKIGAVHLWGVFPRLHMPDGFKHTKYANDVHSGNPMRYNIRSLIPLEISKAVLHAMQTQSTLARWIH